MNIAKYLRALVAQPAIAALLILPPSALHSGTAFAEVLPPPTGVRNPFRQTKSPSCLNCPMRFIRVPKDQLLEIANITCQGNVTAGTGNNAFYLATSNPLAAATLRGIVPATNTRTEGTERIFANASGPYFFKGLERVFVHGGENNDIGNAFCTISGYLSPTN